MASQRRRGDSLTIRMIGVSVFVALIAALVTLLVALPLVNQGAKVRAEAELARLADVGVAALQQPVDPADISRVQRQFEAAGVDAYLIGPRLAPVPGLDTRVQQQILQGASISGSTRIDGSEVLVAGRPLTGGFGLLLVAPADTSDLIGEDLRRLLIAVLIGAAVAAAIGLVVARRLTRPLRNAAEAAERLSAGEREVRLDAAGPREIADIAESLNRLGDSLATSEGRQREFLLSVSHELRTPLTAIRGYGEALSDGLTADSSAAGAAVVDETRRLERLVADLLDLARLGAVDMSIELTGVDLRETVRRAAAAWQQRCDAAAVELRIEIPQDAVTVQADPERVRQILDNLIENALRVTPSGQPIVLAVAGDEYYGAMSVRDGGPGLTEADMAVAFEPAELFSRYQGVRKVGTGVGLALVGRLADRMGGVARVWPAPEGGAAFGVWLPLASPRTNE